MLRLAGPVTMQNAATALADALAALARGEREFSLADFEGSDSSAIALLLELQRQAERAAASLRFADVPASLSSFTHLYGLEAILPALTIDAASQHP